MNWDYELLVIGAGPGGLAAAESAANYGVRVAIAEQEQVGGTCVVHGCIPEKLMTYAAGFSKVFERAGRMNMAGVMCPRTLIGVNLWKPETEISSICVKCISRSWKKLALN